MTPEQLSAAQALVDAMNRDPSDEHECNACGETYYLREGCHPSSLCDGCMQDAADLVPQLLAAVETLTAERDRFAQLAAERYEEAEELHAALGDATQTRSPTIAALREQLADVTAERDELRRERDAWRKGAK